jgi:uncharacterized protein YuzE
MKMTYDRDADALYIRLRDTTEQVEVTRLSQEVACDMDADGRVVGIEILNASVLFSRPESPSVELEYSAPRKV